MLFTLTNSISHTFFRSPASEMSEAEILDDFPDLTREDLKACIAYAADRERRFMNATSA